MRYVATLFVAIISITSQPGAAQTRSGGPAAGQPAVRACAVLTRDLVAPLTENKKVLDLIPPSEETLAAYRYAELMVWTSKHALDLQVSVPSGSTAEAIKPGVIALASAIIAKLP